MKIITPITITADNLTSTNVAGSSLTAWSSSATYGDGSSVVADNSDGVPHEYTWTIPAEDTSEPSATSATPPTTHSVTKLEDMDGDAKSTASNYQCYWLDLGPTNQHAMFSQRSRRATENADEIIVEITPGKLFNGVALINIQADTVNIEVNDPSEVSPVYGPKSIDMMDLSNVYDAYTWCFAPLIRRSDVVLLDFPAYPLATIKITIADPGGTASIGEVVVGQILDIGNMLYGASISGTDYSTNDTDDQGYTTLEAGTYAKEISYPVRVPTADLHYVQRTISAASGKPVVAVGVDDRDETIIYGVITDFSEVLSGPIKSDCSITVRELSL